MTLQNCGIYASVGFYLLAKIICYTVESYRASMFNKSGTVLTSIPENDENEIKKWVPKKKHEVLKAKYKCLKKLFQIYDASVIGILPETYENECELDPPRRRRRSHRTKTDACAGTAEASSGDASEASVNDNASTIATTEQNLKGTQCSCTFTQPESTVTKCYEPSERSCDVTDKESKVVQPHTDHPVPYLVVNERPRLTRFQCFLQRILGIRRERYYKSLVHPDGHVYAASDNNMTPQYSDKRRRRGLRRLRRPRKIHSDGELRGVGSPRILTYVQSVQRNCLMDTTPRQCPILGCKMIFYGIINYNDHLNLCHFTERKYVCHYCHEGFEQPDEKYVHENEHIGISKLSGETARHSRRASVTQTEPRDLSDEKLKKIVSFFDKIANPQQMLSDMKKNRHSESNLQRSKQVSVDTSSESEPDKRTLSCANLHRQGRAPTGSSRTPIASVTCHFCGENFDYRRQLSLHVDLEHRVHNKYSKFHSCAGITNPKCLDSEEGSTECKSKDKPLDTRRKSEESLSYEPSTNIVYYTSTETINSKREPITYKWEPGTKIIRV